MFNIACNTFLYRIFFGGLECVGHSSLMSPIYDFWGMSGFVFLRDVWIRFIEGCLDLNLDSQSVAVASWRATDFSTNTAM